MSNYSGPDIVDFAYQIISMQEQIESLERELDHYKQLHASSCEESVRRDKHNQELTGLIMGAVFNPKSVINKGHEALLMEQLKEVA